MEKKTLEDCANIDSFINYCFECFVAASASIYEMEMIKEKFNTMIDKQIALNKKNTSFKFYENTESAASTLTRVGLKFD